MNKNWTKTSAALMLLTLIQLFFTSNVYALNESVDIEQAMTKVANSIKSGLEEESLGLEITIGEFIGPPSLKASGGKEIARVLADQLKAIGVEVKDDAAQQLTGSYKLVQTFEKLGDTFKSVGLEIEVKVLSGGAFPGDLFERSIKYFGDQILTLGGVDVELPPDASPKEKQEEIVDQVKKPRVVIIGDQTRSSKDSKFGIEVRVVEPRGSKGRTPKIVNKKSFVDLELGEEYEVVLHNRADFMAAVSLNIDGVNIFVDAKDAAKKSKIILRPGKSARIPGWYITASKSKAFLISGYEDSVAKRVGSTLKVGTISAVFQACWEKDSPPPADEPAGTAKSVGKATSQGRDIEQKYKKLGNLNYGVIRSVVNIRYDR